MVKMVELSKLANGAVDERLNIELQKVLDNIQDENTDAIAARKITLAITLKPDETRSLANVSVQAKTTLAPAISIGSVLMLDVDTKGNAVAAELKSGIPGQSYFNEDGEVLNDKGKPVLVEESKQNKVLGFK